MVAQFPSVDQFRWIAWFLVVVGAVYVLAVGLGFRESCPKCTKIAKLTEKKETERDASSSTKQSFNFGVSFNIIYFSLLYCKLYNFVISIRI